MRSLSRRGWVVVVVPLQLLVVGAAVAAPISARLTGQEVRLRVATIPDERAFRGSYAGLTYPDLPAQRGGDEMAARTPVGDTAFVTLRRSGDVWVSGVVSSSRPRSGPYLACADQGWQIQCGIERWYVPGGAASPLATALRDGTAVATVKVDSRGHAALVAVTAR